MDATKAIKEALWLRGLFGELSLEQGLTMVFCNTFGKKSYSVFIMSKPSILMLGITSFEISSVRIKFM